MILRLKTTTILAIICLAFSINAFSIDYTFSSSVGGYIPNVGGTNIWVSGDDKTSNNIPIGFNFTFGTNAPVTEVSVNSNGWLALGSNFLANYTSYNSNNLATTSFGPVIAPLWDDLSIASGGNVNYITTGSIGNRIFTVEWYKMKWDYGALSAVISFQVKLYESNGDIEFIYSSETGNVSAGSASIGIANQSATDFYSLNNSSSSPVANYGTQTNNISAKPATDQLYRWSNNNSTPSISISSDVNSICFGTTVTFSANAVNAGATPTYQWTLNGNNVGTNSTYSNSSLVNNDVVTCILTPTTGNDVTSNSVTMTVISTTTPTISASGSILTSSAITGNQWYLNGTIINGAINQNYTVTQDGNYTVTSTENSCTSAPSAVFVFSSAGITELNEQPFSIYPNPTSGSFSISIPSELSFTQIEILDLLGQRVYSFNGPSNTNNTFNCNVQLIRGEYIVKVISLSTSMVQKLVVE